jgi:hypothetical protein
MTSIKQVFLDIVDDEHPVGHFVEGLTGVPVVRERPAYLPPVRSVQTEAPETPRALPEPSVGCPTERDVRNAEILEDLMSRVCVR